MLSIKKKRVKVSLYQLMEILVLVGSSGDGVLHNTQREADLVHLSKSDKSGGEKEKSK